MVKGDVPPVTVVARCDASQPRGRRLSRAEGWQGPRQHWRALFGQAGVTYLPAYRLGSAWLRALSWLSPSSAPEFQGPQGQKKGTPSGALAGSGMGQMMKAQAFPGDCVCTGDAGRHSQLEQTGPEGNQQVIGLASSSRE